MKRKQSKARRGTKPAAERFRIVHESEAGVTLEKGNIFEHLVDAPYHIEVMLRRSCNLLEGDALRVRVVKRRQARRRA